MKRRSLRPSNILIGAALLCLLVWLVWRLLLKTSPGLEILEGAAAVGGMAGYFWGYWKPTTSEVPDHPPNGE